MTDALTARSEILARIRSAKTREAPLLSAETAWEAIPRDYRQTGALDLAGRIDLLVERLRDYGAGVYRTETPRLSATIAEILRQQNRNRILVPPDLDPSWLPADSIAGSIFMRDNALSYAELDGCDGVLTGCVVAIAATGTLGLCHGPGDGIIGDHPGQGRRALTLIPDYHLCVVKAADVVESVPEAMRVLEPYKNQPITLISGPSATADIEMTRIQGVHGPRVLDVVIIY